MERKDGLHVDANGTKVWYLNGKLHREDGAAIEYVGGTKYWYLNGVELTEEEFKMGMCLGKFINKLS